MRIRATLSISDMVEGLLDFLDGSSLLEPIADVWNFFVEMTFGLLGVRPDTGTFSGVWKQVVSLYDIMLPIGVSLLILYFVIGFCRDTIDIKSNANLENILKLFIRFIIASNLVTYAMTYIPKFFAWAIDLADLKKKLNLKLDIKTLQENLDGVYIVGLIFALIFAVVVIVCGMILVLSVATRFFKLYIIVPLAPIALAGAAGGGMMTGSAVAWIKTFLGDVFEIVVVALALAISGKFVSASIFTATLGDGWNAALMSMVEVMIKLLVIVSAVKGAETTLRKALGL